MPTYIVYVEATEMESIILEAEDEKQAQEYARAEIANWERPEWKVSLFDTEEIDG